MSFWNNIDFTSIITLSNMDCFDSYSAKRNDDGTVSIITKYNTDIHSLNISVLVDPTKTNLPVLSRLSSFSKQIMIVPTDN